MYQNLNRLNHLTNFIEDGGKRINFEEDNSNLFGDKITIITVVKNSHKNLEKTINSVQKQKFPNKEYIIIDGNSKDGTKELIKKYENELDYWCCIKDEGIYDAMNYGLKLSSGNIITILNSGDVFTVNALDIVSKYFYKNKNLDYLFGTVERHYLNNNIILKSGFDKKRIKYNFDSQTCHSSGFFIKESLQKKIGLYNLNFKCSSDYNLFYKILTNDKFIGNSTKKSEMVGIVASGGFSSQYGFWNRLLEESKIRIHNQQNYFLILIIFLNTIFKYYLKKIFKN